MLPTSEFSICTKLEKSQCGRLEVWAVARDVAAIGSSTVHHAMSWSLGELDLAA